MKVGILTFYRLPNYGANLQAFSTYKYLENKGYEPIFINWMPDDFYNSKILNSKDPLYTQVHLDFFDNNCNQTERCINEDDISDTIEKENIDAIIIGSDAVLQHHPFLSRVVFPTRHFISIIPKDTNTNYPNPFWGSFSRKKQKKNIPIILMSVSCQDTNFFYILGKERRLLGSQLNNFSYISVRDDWTQKMVKYLTSSKIIPPITPDPVFGLNNNAGAFIPSKEIILKKFSLPASYAIISFWSNKLVSENWLKEIKSLLKQQGSSPVAFPMPGGISFKHNFDYSISKPITPLDWYALIKYADSYIGEKMHPIISSLSNSVPCFCFDHCQTSLLRGLITYEKSSKIYHIMKDFDVLENRVNGRSHNYVAPSPKRVIDQINKFNKIACQAKSNEALNKYLLMMKNIEKIINYE